MDPIRLNIFYFLLLLIYYRSIYHLIEYLCKEYPDKNIIVTLFYKKLHIIQTKEQVQQVLSKDANTTITFANDNFFAAHNHPLGIGNLEQTDWKWSIIHKGLAHALGTSQNMIDSIERNKHILLGKYGFQYNVKVLDEFTLAVWADFCFGEKVNHDKYKEMQHLLITTLKKTFYNHTSRTIPYLGAWMVTFRKWYYYENLQKVDSMLCKLLESNTGFMGRFRLAISDKFHCPYLINQIVLDNAFLSVLVFDFLYIVLINAVIDIAKNKLSHEERLKKQMNYFYNGFLFPNRIRYNTKTGDYYIVNLLKANLPFSYGPRSCVGPLISDTFYKYTMELLKDFTIESLDKNPIVHNSDPNIPNIISQHTINLTLPENYIQTHIPFYPKNNLKFYRIEAICENSMLLNYIIDQMTKKVNELNVDVIVTADARGFLFASPVAAKTNKPLVIMRKAGKLAGPVDEISYQKAYGTTEIIEISMDSNLKDKRVVIIDDGIASGGTTCAMYNLVTQRGGRVVEVIVALKHTYCNCEYKSTPVRHLFMN